jgi:S-methylmethionine-dependent homocysteine/selenocysteine methylase
MPAAAGAVHDARMANDARSAMYRDRLPQLDGGLFLTDGGIETTLIFHDGLDLPLFAAFDLLKDEHGTAALRRYFETYAQLAREHEVGIVLESPTWRASPRWARELGYSLDELAALNVEAIALLEDVRERYQSAATPVVISGCVGPHDDGYDPAMMLSAAAAQRYHATQIETFAATAADLVTAITMTYAEEAIGVTRAAAEAGMPVVISFTVETDGRLPSGEGLGDAIRRVDDATGAAPAYYMINCAHPTHFEAVLSGGEAWQERIQGLRANASTKSHAELDEAEELDAGDAHDLARRYVALRDKLPRLHVLGGCCGTDDGHVGQICDAWTSAPALAGPAPR